MEQQDFDCRILIKNLYPSLHNVEKKIADYILFNPKEVTGMTIAQFAATVKSSESSIVRFCQMLSFKGFSQLKINLACHLTPDINLMCEDVCRTDSNETIVDKVFASGIRVLEDTRKFIKTSDFNKVIDVMYRANKIEFYGVYTSAVIARDAHNRLRRIGFPVHAITDPYEARISASMLEKGSVAVGISHTGRTKDTIDILKMAKASGADTIAITSTLKSPIVEVADVSLVICSDEQQIFREAVSSRLAHIVLLDAICVCLGNLKYDETSERIKENTNIINEMRY
jgi:DNA-binding MurR/RpiR family transcriptional regulator